MKYILALPESLGIPTKVEIKTSCVGLAEYHPQCKIKHLRTRQLTFHKPLKLNVHNSTFMNKTGHYSETRV